jgi:hypothetical protein
MGCWYLEQRVVWIFDRARRPSAGVGPWIIAAALVAGLAATPLPDVMLVPAASAVGTLLGRRIDVGGVERPALRAEPTVMAQATPSGGQRTIAGSTPCGPVPGQGVEGDADRREGSNKLADGSEADQPKHNAGVPITGRIVDQDGRPVSAARVRVTRVLKARGGSLTPWIEAVRRGQFSFADTYLVDPSTGEPTAYLVSRSTGELREKLSVTTTDPEGRFKIEGFGDEQVLALMIEGPMIASTLLSVITRRTDPIDIDGIRIFGADFSVTVSPTRPVEGVVRDAKTRQPLAGVEIKEEPFSVYLRGAWESPRTTTDTHGHFRLLGLSKEPPGGFLIVSKHDQAYFGQPVAVTNTTAFDLRLTQSLNDVRAIPSEGKNLVVIAVLKHSFYIRIFDGEGKLVVNADEKTLADEGLPRSMRLLRKELAGLWPPHEPSRAEKHRVISFVASLVDFGLPEPPANAPVRLEIDLHRGIWIEGKVTDKETGQPVPGVLLHYEAMVENPFAGELPEFSDRYGRTDFYDESPTQWCREELRKSKLDGTYRLVGLPGRGIVGVDLEDMPYLQEGYGGLDAQGRFRIDPLPSGWFPFPRFSTAFPTPVKEINPPPGVEACRVDIELVPGARVRLRVVDAQGLPVTGVRIAYVIPAERFFARREASAEFDVLALSSRERRLVLIRHEGRKLGKGVSVGVGDDKNGPVVVMLEPLASIMGRVTAADGKPGTWVAVISHPLDWSPFFGLDRGLSTDGDGKFVVPDVPVGCQYKIQANATTAAEAGTGFTSISAEAPKPVSVRPGQTTDVGEIRFKDHPAPAQ